MSPFPFASYIIAAIFGIAVVTTIAGAIIAVWTTRLIRAVSGLMICCIGLAGLYYFLHSPFLALMEILIYVGAVCVTMVFAVMLAEPDEPQDTTKSRAGFLWGALATIASALIAIAVARVSVQAPWPAPPVERLSDGSVAAIGKSLLTTYCLAFELISLVLLVAILGALVIARGGRNRPRSIDPSGLGIVAAEVTTPAPPPPEQPGPVSPAATEHIESIRP